MAGKIQFAAKCLLGTTLLASGSGGVYYASTHGWSLPSADKTKKQPAAELDAVASAWAEPAAKRALGVADSSPVARSAHEAPAHAEKPAVKSSDVDRYAMTAKTPTPAIVVKEVKTENKTKHTEQIAKDESKEKTPTPAKPVDATVAKLDPFAKAKPNDKPDADRSPTPAVLTPQAPITRGQEPKDDAPPTATKLNDVSADISGAFDAAPKTGAATSAAPPTEPKTLNATAQKTNTADSAQRAKQAFGIATPL